ncbi:uncharacterized protein LOC114119596 [Aphis gossypii]|uniref:uncharacterized protein LOC114119596 n=1 Tax=Aphis gossypii TaxID=80765 RepID=UPI002159962C|nr:uncharacterized protein LOC114119596 [Aphis gossypii]XP_050053161.1 uncharacterized protein LOC114119596 [Aphis gossypii]XP_050053162.1 uncharacterized protein LOC114119596 [Aphis gossypii]
MFSSDSSSITHTSASEFTAQAVVHILERTSKLSLVHYNGVDRPFLGELSTDGDNEIKQLVQTTFPNCNISKIKQVYYPQMYGMYLLREEEMKLEVGRRVQEKLLFHVTTESRAMESLSSGLDWRRTQRNKFGCGVSFSDNADYANYYADKSPSEDTRVIMICCVLVRETYVVPRQNDGNDLIVPPDFADTSVSHTGHVYVKYNDNEFYPLFFAFYRREHEHRITSKFYRANNYRGRSNRSYNRNRW